MVFSIGEKVRLKHNPEMEGIVKSVYTQSLLFDLEDSTHYAVNFNDDLDIAYIDAKFLEKVKSGLDVILETIE